MRQMLLVGVAVLLSVAAVGADDKKPGTRAALLIGVQKYNSDDLHDLECADRDVEDLAEALRANGYKSKDITLLNTRGKEVPTAKRIRAALEEFLGRDYGKDDIVLIAFSGHGVQIGKKFYFCPAGARLPGADPKPAELRELISIDELYQKLKDCSAGYRLVLTDCCRNNPYRSPRKIREVSEDLALDEGLPRNVVLITSCSPGQKAYEDKDAFGRGVFFHFVIEGLKGKADLNEDGKVTRAELEAYLRLQMAKHKSKQTPETLTRSRQDPALVEIGNDTLPGVLRPTGRIVREAYGGFYPAPTVNVNAKYAATVDGGVLQVFDLERRRLFFKGDSQANGNLVNVAFSQSGAILVPGNSAATFVNPLTGKVLSTAKLKFSPSHVGMSRDEKTYFASYGPDIVVLDPRGNVLETFNHGAEHVTAAALVGSGETLVAGTNTGKVFVYDVKNGKQLHDLEGHTKQMVGIYTSRDSTQAVTVCSGGKLVRWNLETGAKIDSAEVNVGTAMPYKVAFQLDGRRALVGYDQGMVGILDIPPKGKVKVLVTYDKHSTKAWASVAVARDGSRAISVAGTEVWIYELPKE